MSKKSVKFNNDIDIERRVKPLFAKYLVNIACIVMGMLGLIGAIFSTLSFMEK